MRWPAAGSSGRTLWRSTTRVLRLRCRRLHPQHANTGPGTYNNQYMVVDTNRFSPGRPLSAGLLWVVEQVRRRCRFRRICLLRRLTRARPADPRAGGER